MLTAPRAQNTFLKRNLAFRYLEYVSTVENNQRYATKKICYQGHICFFDLKMFMSQCARISCTCILSDANVRSCMWNRNYFQKIVSIFVLILSPLALIVEFTDDASMFWTIPTKTNNVFEMKLSQRWMLLITSNSVVVHRFICNKQKARWPHTNR